MNKDGDSALRRAKRAVIWNILYYAAILFSTFYLVKKDVLLNWDVTLVFLPLFFVACSSETLSLKRNKVLSPFCFIDFPFKLLAFISAQLIYRHIVADVYVGICITLLFICSAVSFVCSVLMIIRSKNKN